jgi:aspartyl-tRNA(Asn)/glutamyl-tRNA(Gln) amidotransferase subunit A
MQVELTLDTCGPIAKSVEDVALLLTAISGYDKLDIISVAHGTEDYTASIRHSVSDIRVGIPRKPYFDDVDQEVAKSVETALGVIGKLTRGIKDVTLPPDLTEKLRLIEVAEVPTYHHKWQLQGYAARYEVAGKNDPIVRGNLSRENCTQAASARCDEGLEAYVQLKWDLDLLRRTAGDVFSDFDVVAVPTTKTMPIPIADVLRPGAANPTHSVIHNTLPFNFYGWPAISVPCGYSSDGLPIGLMIGGPRFTEGRLLALAYAYEQATSWHLERPSAYL